MRSFLLIMLFIPLLAQGQEEQKPLYHFNPWWEVPFTISGFVFNFFGQQALVDKPRLVPADYQGLSPKDVGWFDRSATRQDPDFADEAQVLSDIGLSAFPFMPILLLLDRPIRNEWKEFILLYLETHSIGADAYLFVSLPIRRKRPYVFNPDETSSRKEGGKSTDSFFSGHVSVVAVSTFSMAKIYTDYHNIRGMKRVLIFTAASLPPVYTGIFRYKAGKHYLSDLLVGFAVGASIGILNPQLHKSKNTQLSLRPIIDPQGLSASFKF